jgi:16S rRNA (guanine527-N7)-methyltransferase
MFLKGQDVVAEIEEATKSWKFEYHLIPSLSDPSGRILVVEGSARARA